MTVLFQNPTLRARNLPAPALKSAPSSLAELGRQFDITIAAERAASDVHADKEAAFFNLKKVRPDALKWRPEDDALRVPGHTIGWHARDALKASKAVEFWPYYGAEEIKHLKSWDFVVDQVIVGDTSVRIEKILAGQETRQRVADILAAHDAMEHDHKASGIDRLAREKATAERKLNVIEKRAAAIVRKITAARSTSAADVAVKVRALAYLRGCPVADLVEDLSDSSDPEATLAGSIIGDLSTLLGDRARLA